MVVFLIGSSQLAVGLVHWAATLLVRPRVLPRLDFSKGIPPESRTVVAVPVLLTDVVEIDGLLESMEIRYLANRDPSLSFALVSDHRDAPREKMEGDDVLLARAVDGINALNAKYASDSPAASAEAPFFLFHRARDVSTNVKASGWAGSASGASSRS